MLAIIMYLYYSFIPNVNLFPEIFALLKTQLYMLLIIDIGACGNGIMSFLVVINHTKVYIPFILLYNHKDSIPKVAFIVTITLLKVNFCSVL